MMDTWANFNDCITETVTALERFMRELSRWRRRDELYIEPWHHGRTGRLRVVDVWGYIHDEEATDDD